MESRRAFSRPIATALSLGDKAPDRHIFVGKNVLLTGEAPILFEPNGKDCFLNALRLLLRMYSRLTISLPHNQSLLDSTKRIVHQLALPCEVTYADSADYSNFDAILSVGSRVRKGLPWTTINSNGWLARISSIGKDLSSDVTQRNPIGALAAASLGVSEIFKRTISLKPERGLPFGNVSFSFYSYTESEDHGPMIPPDLPMDVLLVGVGAIGNGIVHLLKSLPLRGSIVIVDRQVYEDENLGTCFLIGSDDVGRAKASFAEAQFEPNIDVNAYPEPLELFHSRLGKEISFPKVVISALDNIEARRSVQTLWPTLIIDGAISEFACGVSLHPWNKDLSCILCDFEETSVSALDLQSELTGVRKTRLSNLDTLVTKEDIDIAPPERRAWLRQRLGQKLCSVVSEATTQAISSAAQDSGFQPSVPFVACLSACMCVGEYVRCLMQIDSPLDTGFQMDVLQGPLFGRCTAHARKPSCICVSRRCNIELLRKMRYPN